MKRLTTLIVVIAAAGIGAPVAAASLDPSGASLDPSGALLDPGAAGGLPSPSPAPRVVGGGVDETPGVDWVAALSQRGFYVCSGSLVAPRFVLTAAHCTRGSRPRGWVVRIGSKDRRDGGHVRRVQRIVEFPGYRPALDFGDMALLRLRAPVPVDPVELADRGSRGAGERAFLAGWGQTAARDPRPPRLLRSAWIPIRRDRVCRRQYGWGFDGRAMLCAGAPRVSACMGDSGGPLARGVEGGWQLVGVTSFGGPRCNRPGGYAWVGSPSLRAWLAGRLGR